MKLPVLVNQGGGTAGDDSMARIRAALSGAGLDARVERVAGPDLFDRARGCASRGAKMVVAAGGDGTASAVGGALVGSRAALGILPLGTRNHLARDLAIPLDLGQAAALLAAGHRRRIDVAELNGHAFLNNSAIGLYPLMVADREDQQAHLGRSKKMAMLVAGLRTLARFHHHRLSLTVNDGDQATLETPLLFVGNNHYRLALPRAGVRDRLDDGRLTVAVMRKAGRLGLAAAMVRSLTGHSRPGDLIQLDDVTRLQVAGRRSHLTVSLDGEILRLAPPLDYRIRPKALWVMTPPA